MPTEYPDSSLGTPNLFFQPLSVRFPHSLGAWGLRRLEITTCLESQRRVSMQVDLGAWSQG